jgi:hypothetical protein
MIKFELSLEEAQIVLVGLSKLPYEAVAGLIDKIKEQAAPQIQPPAETPAE